MSELFENQSIVMKDLPRIHYEEFMPIERKFRSYLLLRNSLFFIVFFVIAIVVHIINASVIMPWIIFSIYSVLALFWSLSILLVIVGFPRKGYLLRQHDLLYKTGYLMQKVTAIPKNRIQHIEIRQGILLRIMGLSKIVVFTAGGSSSDLSISGLQPEVAQQLKEDISLNISTHE
jgi:membrane protein YdbS with pleckstrin-like domain